MPESTVSEQAADARLTQRLRLSGFVLDLTAGELLTSDLQLAGLRKQALYVLLVLGARPGQVVGKDELMRAVWRDVVVGEGSLAQAVADIRHVLQDRDHRMVRTVARRGYMLVPDPAPAVSGLAPVEPPETSVPEAFSTNSDTSLTPRTPSRASIAALVAIVLGTAALIGMGALLKTEHRPATTLPLAPKVPSVSLVVLPLKNDESGKSEDWFADAITSDLTTSMGRMSGSFVIGRNTAFTYKGKDVDPRNVARELGVRYVVLGNTRRDGELVRLSLAMIDGESGVQLWGQQFDIERAELSRSIDDIVGQLARTLFVQMFHSVGDRAARLKSSEVAADDLAMRGWSMYMRGLSPENLRESLQLFEVAAAKDPNSVRALAGISNGNNFGVIIGWLPDKVAALRRAEEATARLEQLGADDWFALVARISQRNVRGEWENMLRLVDTLIERYPNDPSGQHLRSTALLYVGRFEESTAAAQRAIRLSPRDTRLGLWHWHVGTSQFILGQYDAATESARRGLAASPKTPLAIPLLAASLARNGQKDEAEKLLRDYLVANPSVDTASVSALMRSNHPRFVDGRDRMLISLRELGLR